jgi:putative ABC transport system substrate-binding protein
MHADALFVSPHQIMFKHRQRIIDFANTNRLPALYGAAVFVEAGGLMSYYIDWVELKRRTADYVDKILKGRNPADLPVEWPSKFELVINLKTAKEIGVTISPKILLQADKVIK